MISSHTPEYKEGDIVEGFTLGWQEYAIANPASIRKINSDLAPIQTAVGSARNAWNDCLLRIASCRQTNSW